MYPMWRFDVFCSSKTYHSMYFVPKIAKRWMLSIEVSYAKGGFMHFVPTIGAETLKKEGLRSNIT